MAGKFYVYGVAADLDLSSAGNGLDADGTKLYCTTLAKNVADRAVQVGCSGGRSAKSHYNSVERVGALFPLTAWDSGPSGAFFSHLIFLGPSVGYRLGEYLYRTLKHLKHWLHTAHRPSKFMLGVSLYTSLERARCYHGQRCLAAAVDRST